MIENYTRNIHPDLVYSIFYRVGVESSKGIQRISEDTVQNIIDDIINYKFNNTDYSGDREKIRRFDHCIYKKGDKEKKKACVVIELKTYFKKDEGIKESEILEDISKLLNYKNEFPSVRAYVFLVGLSSKFKKLDPQKAPQLANLVSLHLGNKRKETKIDLTKLNPKSNSKKVHDVNSPILRPSIKKCDNNISCMSWEVKPSITI